MTEHEHEHEKDLQPPTNPPEDGLGAAEKSLSEALRISFISLKIIMIILVVIFLASGFKTVGSGEQAMVLTFGRISGVGESRLLGPGLKWILPYPIQEMIKIPVEKTFDLPVNSFWYYQSEQELLGKPQDIRRFVKPALHPVREGYCMTRGENQDATAAAGSDYNIVHCKWSLTYKIDDPERFFKNIYIDLSVLQPGQSYADIIEDQVTPLLQHLLQDSVVTAMVNYTIDQAIKSQDRIPRHVEKLMQQKLDQAQSGIKVVSVLLTDITWPRQVDIAFVASIAAKQAGKKIISEAKGYAEKTLNEAGGAVTQPLLNALEDENISSDRIDQLWAQLAGQAQEELAKARAYRTKVVEDAKANADYLKSILPEYRKRPKLVIQEIYQDAIEQVLNNIEEKIIIQPTQTNSGAEIRILLNRDPAIKPKGQEQ